jgi:predicted kinase
MYTRKFLDKKQSVIVDRCNFDRDQRRTWIELAQYYKVPVDCIVLTANQQVNSWPQLKWCSVNSNLRV